MIVQYNPQSLEWGYRQADDIFFHKHDISHIQKQFNPRVDMKEEDEYKLYAAVDDYIYDQIGTRNYRVDDKDYIYAPTIAIVTTQNNGQSPQHLVLTKASYLLNDNGKTILAII